MKKIYKLSILLFAFALLLTTGCSDPSDPKGEDTIPTTDIVINVDRDCGQWDYVKIDGEYVYNAKSSPSGDGVTHTYTVGEHKLSYHNYKCGFSNGSTITLYKSNKSINFLEWKNGGAVFSIH